MNKKECRKAVKKEIEELSEEYIAFSNNGIFENFISLSEFKKATTIFAYISEKREPDTVKIILKALDMGKTVALPISYDNGRMEPRIIYSLDDLVIGKYGIPAPTDDAQILKDEDIELIIVPAMTFNRKGFRLGRGGGYYDRFLEKSKAFSVGLGREKLIREIPLQPHDMSVTCLITETGIFK